MLKLMLAEATVLMVMLVMQMVMMLMVDDGHGHDGDDVAEDYCVGNGTAAGVCDGDRDGWW